MMALLDVSANLYTNVMDAFNAGCRAFTLPDAPGKYPTGC